MSAVSPAVAENNPATGIAFIVVGVLLISVNDMLIKFLSGGYPLHEMVFVRSAIGISFNLVFLHFEGGFAGLRTSTPLLHAGRCFSVVLANMLFFAALASMPLPDATAVFFVGPLFVTLLSIFLLGEKVGARRMLAVAVGFVGVLVMVRPGSDLAAHIAHPAILALPVLAAFFYALFNILTRKLGVSAKASALAIYIQAGFLIVGAAFGLIAGDGRYAEGVENESLQFLLRAWQWPQGNDIWLFVLLGLNGAAVGYSLSRAYKSADAATIAPFEYVALPFAILWGWTIWGDVPGPSTFVGIVLIAGAGLYVFLRERQKKRPVTKLRLRRWQEGGVRLPAGRR